MRQDGVGANVQVSEDGTRVTGRRPLAPNWNRPRGETVERSLFSLWLSCTINNVQSADGCVSPSDYVQVRPIVGCGTSAKSERKSALGSCVRFDSAAIAKWLMQQGVRSMSKG
jgi:hypothetical protein